MKALIVVDAQYDFMPGGNLAVAEGDEIIKVINKLLPKFGLVVFTKDWHPEKMEAFASYHDGKKPLDTYINSDGAEDLLWPDHCIAGTPGAEIHKDIDFGLINGDFYIIKKGTQEKDHPYSGFGNFEFNRPTELATILDSKGIQEVFVVGLAGDYCVKDTAIDAVKDGFLSRVILDGTKFVDPSNKQHVLNEFLENDVKVIEEWELDLFNLTQ